ncbi:MAG: HEPN domain-containing protein [Thermoplasmata archaeon]
MNTLEMAVLALKRSERWLQGATRALEDERWDDAVFSAQMCSEHAAKAVLILLGIDFPKQHDVSDVFFTLKARRDLPPDFREQVEGICGKLAQLAAERALAGYGFEEGVGPDNFRDRAPEAIADAGSVLESCARLVERVSADPGRPIT